MIVDLILPEIDGYEVVKEIREEENKYKLKSKAFICGTTTTKSKLYT